MSVHKELPAQSLELPLLQQLPATRLERLQNTSVESILVAAHELSHWVVGHHFGYLGDIEMNPEGYSRARTVFGGYIPPEHLSYMLGAGAVDTPHSQAFGYGMDKYMINYLSRWSGIDFKNARSGARAILAGYDFNVLKRAAEILGYLGNNGAKISGETITSILERAKQELFLEGKQVDLKQKIKKLEREQIEEEKPQRQTIIEDKVDIVRIVYYKGKKKEAELIMCKVCRRFDCEHIQNLDQKEKAVIKNYKTASLMNN